MAYTQFIPAAGPSVWIERQVKYEDGMGGTDYYPVVAYGVSGEELIPLAVVDDGAVMSIDELRYDDGSIDANAVWMHPDYPGSAVGRNLPLGPVGPGSNAVPHLPSGGGPKNGDVFRGIAA